jgi:hypothetical protein
MSLKYTGLWVRAFAVITICDGNNQPVSGAIVYGAWSGLTNDSDLGQTDTSGTVTVSSDKVRNPKSGSQFTFAVTNVELSGWIYDSASNIETSDSINIP